MNIQFASDLHLEIPKNNRYFQQEKITPFADILILAGDTMYWDEDYLQNPFWDVVSSLLLHKFLSFREIISFIKDLIWLLFQEKVASGTIRDNVHWYYNQSVVLEGVQIILSTLLVTHSFYYK